MTNDAPDTAHPDRAGPIQGAAGFVHLSHLGPPVTKVVLAGEVDLAVKDAVHNLIGAVREAGSAVHFDASALTFIDSVGLTAITRLARCTDRRAVLSHPPQIMRFLLDVTGLEAYFTITPSSPELVQDLTGDLGEPTPR